MSRAINQGTILEWDTNGGGLGHSALSALDGGSIPPDMDVEYFAVNAEGEALHEIVHTPVMNWFKNLAQRHGNQEGLPPEVISTSSGCLGLAIFRSYTDVFDPNESAELSNLYQLLISCIYVGACLHQDMQSGALSFEDDENSE